MIPEGAIISGFISKIINDLVDVSKTAIKKAMENKASKNQDFQSQVYQIIVNVLNQITYNQYKNDQDKIYDAAGKLLSGFKSGRSNPIKIINSGLSTLISPTDTDSNAFLALLYQEISQDEFCALYHEIILLQQGKESQKTSRIEQKIDVLGKKIDDIKDERAEDIENPDDAKRVFNSRTQEYANKWQGNMFLNDFDEHDENAGVNITLESVYIKKHLPHYKWMKNENSTDDLEHLLDGYIRNHEDNRMLLILGQPGIGKSTLVTWITANYEKQKDNILVYQFASDLKNVDWNCTIEDFNLWESILQVLGLTYDDLNGKRLIFDGFDEISIGIDRLDIINKISKDALKSYILHNFSLIITCRENYIHKLNKIKCNHITLQPWDTKQMQSFCKIYQEKSKNEISEDTMKSILQNQTVFGIPLILYMILALNISIEQDGSIVDVYDKIFSLEGGIYDRCINNAEYGDAHRISEIKSQIHQISRDIAICMFENHPDKAIVSQREYKEICENVRQENKIKNKNIEQDFLIGNYFRLVKHCEGIETEELCFIHRTIYEYFVAETIYNAIENSLLSLSENSQKELAGNIAFYLKQGRITITIGKYIKYKIMKLYSKLEQDKQNRFYSFLEKTINKMMKYGMFYYTERNIQVYKNIIAKEAQCFVNLLAILRLFFHETSRKPYIMGNADKNLLERYIKLFLMQYEDIRPVLTQLIDLSNMSLCALTLKAAYMPKVYFRHADLHKANLMGANLQGADLSETCLADTNLQSANLNGAKLQFADLYRANLQFTNLQNTSMRNAYLLETNLQFADLRGTNLQFADLRGAYLQGAIFSEKQILYLEKRYNMQGTRVFIEATKEIIYYEDYREQPNC